MRLALFGSGSPISTAALDALAARFEVALVVVPAGRPGGGLSGARRRWRRRRARRPLALRARTLGIPVRAYAPGGEGALAGELRARGIDLACVATFPGLVPPALLEAPSRGAIGLHPSLLPRHRGPAPLFWTYHAGDAEAGVTVFCLDAGEDTGDVIAQEPIPLPRGRPGRDLYLEVAARGATLLAQAVHDLATGRAQRRPQDAALATREPRPDPRSCQVDLKRWDAEPLGHFLNGVGALGGFVCDERGRLLRHGRVLAWAAETLRPPATVERRGRGWRLHCRNGYVDVEAAPAAARLRGLLAAAFGRRARPRAGGLEQAS